MTLHDFLTAVFGWMTPINETKIFAAGLGLSIFGALTAPFNPLYAKRLPQVVRSCWLCAGSFAFLTVMMWLYGRGLASWALGIGVFAAVYTVFALRIFLRDLNSPR